MVQALSFITSFQLCFFNDCWRISIRRTPYPVSGDICLNVHIKLSKNASLCFSSRQRMTSSIWHATLRASNFGSSTSTPSHQSGCLPSILFPSSPRLLNLFHSNTTAHNKCIIYIYLYIGNTTSITAMPSNIFLDLPKITHMGIVELRCRHRWLHDNVSWCLQWFPWYCSSALRWQCTHLSIRLNQRSSAL